ncbi:hypothetical protein [Variovorax soli]|uniref:hypothetical protein n=1 Tax=Variovorax soli TaxID=376815 RepID=UPI0012948141|nr:hypothetical protein [Variovorax soli]
MRAKKEGRDNSLDARAAFCGRALKAVIALIALVAVVVSVPALSRADFPLASLLIYCIGMGFIAMPLCLYHELLLQRRMHGA